MLRRLATRGFALATLTLATILACGQDEPFGPAAAAGAGGVAAVDAATSDGTAGTPQGGADSSSPKDATDDMAKEAATDAALADAGDAQTVTDATDAPATIVPDFALTDENPASATYQKSVSPRDYLGQVSAWYFGHAT